MEAIEMQVEESEGETTNRGGAGREEIGAQFRVFGPGGVRV